MNTKKSMRSRRWSERELTLPPGPAADPGITRTHIEQRLDQARKSIRFFGSMKAASTASSNISIEGASIKTASSQAYISYQGRKHPRSHNRSRTARPSTHAQPRTGTQGERGWVRGEEGSNPPVHR